MMRTVLYYPNNKGGVGQDASCHIIVQRCPGKRTFYHPEFLQSMATLRPITVARKLYRSYEVPAG